jgi:ATP-dependent Clp protease adaptor protein ClpS
MSLADRGRPWKSLVPTSCISTGSAACAGEVLVMLNDDDNTFDGVAFALAAVLPGVDFERGMTFANRIHNNGQALVWSGHREQAELYWEQLHGHGLTMAPLER